MIRTRDLVVFVIVFLCVSTGATITFVRNFSPNSFNLRGTILVPVSSSESVITAVAPSTPNNRDNIIARLREAILHDGTPISTVSVEEPQKKEEIITTDPQETPVTPTSLQRCGGMDDSLQALTLWPLQDVFVEVREGMRLVEHIEQVVVANSTGQGTTTATSSIPVSQTQTTPLLRMLLYPPLAVTTTCVPSDSIGVTSTGALMSNNDARLYYSRKSDELLGYARDGFPIYGLYEGKTDDCGGYLHPEGYRYTISKQRNEILHCFVGVPNPFLIK